MIKKGYYYHYKHKDDDPVLKYAYEVLGTCLGTEDENVYVLYEPLYEDNHIGLCNWYIRPYDMFIETLIVDSKPVSRFKLITDKKVIDLIDKTKVKKRIHATDK